MYFGPNALRIIALWSWGFAIVVFGFLSLYPLLLPKNSLTDFFAAISYPLYVVHAVAGMVIIRFLILWNFGAITSVLCAAICLTGVAWLLHRAVEMPSQALGKRVQSRVKSLSGGVSANYLRGMRQIIRQKFCACFRYMQKS